MKARENFNTVETDSSFISTDDKINNKVFNRNIFLIMHYICDVTARKIFGMKALLKVNYSLFCAKMQFYL